MYELWSINCKPERLYFTTDASRSGLQFIFHNSYITLRLALYISQLIHHAQACSLYITTHYITLRLTVYISQLIHHAQAYSLYFTTHTSRSGLQFIFHNSYITLRLQFYFTTHTLRSGLQFIFRNSYITLRLTVMYELWNINCKPERDVWVAKYKLQAWA